jgi:GxxExxY protein
VNYKDIVLPELVIDVLVEEVLVLELKAIEKVPDAHLAMLVSYLKAAEKPVGLLINFHAPTLKQGIYRRVNSDAARLVLDKQKSMNREGAMS